MDVYFEIVDYLLDKKVYGWVIKFFLECVCGICFVYDFVDVVIGEVIVKVGDKVILCIVKKLIDEGEVQNLLVLFDNIVGKFVVKDIINEENGVIYVEVGDELMFEIDCDGEIIGGIVKDLIDVGIIDILVLDIDNVNVGLYICNIFVFDKNMNCEIVFMDIYCVMCLGELLIVEVVLVLFDMLFFDSECYDLLVVGCVKMNMCLVFDVEDIQWILCCEDIVVCIKVLVELCDGKGDIDDIDYFGNCCVCLVGELMENQYCVGLFCMECVIKECMLLVEIDIVMFQDLINVKFVVVVVCEFFGLLQLLQFMD